MPFYQDELSLVSKPGKEKQIEVLLKDKDQIHQIPLIGLRSDPNLIEWIHAYLPSDFVAPIQVDQISAVIDLIHTGAYVGFVPRRMVHRELSKGILREIKLPPKMRLKSRTAYLILKSSQRGCLEEHLQTWMHMLKTEGIKLKPTLPSHKTFQTE